jgi:hypothetical protein
VQSVLLELALALVLLQLVQELALERLLEVVMLALPLEQEPHYHLALLQ